MAIKEKPEAKDSWAILVPRAEGGVTVHDRPRMASRPAVENGRGFQRMKGSLMPASGLSYGSQRHSWQLSCSLGSLRVPS